MENANYIEKTGAAQRPNPKVLKIVERVLSLEKLNLHLAQPHLINDVVNIIKEEA